MVFGSGFLGHVHHDLGVLNLVDHPHSLGLADPGPAELDIVAGGVFGFAIGLDGLGIAAQVVEHLALIERYFDKTIRVLGVLPTFFDRRTRISSEVYEALQARYGERVWPPIRIDTKISQAPSARKTIDTFRRNSRGAQDYEAVCDLLIGSPHPVAETPVTRQ